MSGGVGVDCEGMVQGSLMLSVPQIPTREYCGPKPSGPLVFGKLLVWRCVSSWEASVGSPASFRMGCDRKPAPAGYKNANIDTRAKHTFKSHPGDVNKMTIATVDSRSSLSKFTHMFDRRQHTHVGLTRQSFNTWRGLGNLLASRALARNCFRQTFGIDRCLLDKIAFFLFSRMNPRYFAYVFFVMALPFVGPI